MQVRGAETSLRQSAISRLHLGYISVQVRDAETSLRRSLRKSQAELAAVLAHVDVLQVACRHAYAD